MKIQKGNPYTATIKVTDSTGTAYNLTGMTVYFTVKLKTDNTSGDLNAVIKKTITSHTNATGGITSLVLSASDTNVALGSYKADFRVYKDGVTQLNSVTVLCDIIDIVTKRNNYIS